jgi:hypothetical protein
MANEIQLSITSRVTNGAFFDQFQFTGQGIDQAAIGRGGYVQTIGTSEEVIEVGDITTNGFMILKNLDEANYVTWGPESGGSMVVLGKIKFGEPAVLRVAPGVIIRAQADTADVQLDVRLYED